MKYILNYLLYLDIYPHQRIYRQKRNKIIQAIQDYLTSLKFPLVPEMSVGNSSGVLLPQDR